MKQAKQLLILAICAAFSLTLSAQEVFEVNLASITEINVTLNDECEALLIREMVLVGDLDVDGDGNEPGDEFFSIVVQDSDPSNGPIIDECGRFVYRVRAMDRVMTTAPVIGLRSYITTPGVTTPVDIALGTIASPLGAPGNFFFDGVAGTPSDALVVVTDGTVSGGNAFAVFDMAVSEPGTITFNYEFETDAADADNIFSVLDFEGTVLAALTIDEIVLDDTAPGMNVEGTLSVDMLPGYVLRTGIADDGVTSPLFFSVLTINNFAFDPIDVVTPVTGFTTQWGYVNAEDKTPPSVEVTPGNVSLLCVDVEINDVSTLANSVDRCYRVFASTGLTVPGTMSPALNQRLRATFAGSGVTTPRVPTFRDNCAAQLEVCVNDVVVFGADPSCDDVVITRTFTATEVAICPSASGEGNASAVASYTITFIRPTLANLPTGNTIPGTTFARCGVQNPTRADFPAPRTTDFPALTIDGRVFQLSLSDVTCNIGVTFEDGAPVITCPFTYKFVRTYTVIDWCEPSNVRTYTQLVKVGDETAPTFTGPNVPRNAAGDLLYGTNAGNICAAFLRLDDVSAVDNCSGTNVTITARIFPGGNLAGTPIGAFNVIPGGNPELSTAIPAGRHILRYTYTDQCGNTGTTDFFFIVRDETPPVAICEDGLNISIAGTNGSGFAVLTAANLDAGSYDDCSAITRSIAFVDGNDRPVDARGRSITDAQFAAQTQVVLTCEELGTQRVSLRVQDATGNVNYCWLDILVEDKLRPTCVAPGPTTITCVVYNQTLPNDITTASNILLDQLFGQATGTDNCGTTIVQSVSGDINSCGVGSILRTFVSTDGGGLTNVGTCRQFIEIIGVHDYQVTFPADVSGVCALIPGYAGVESDELACDLITTTTDVDTLRTQLAGEECFKLRVTYDVVNWCEYNSLGEPYVIARNANGALNRSRLTRNLENDVIYLNIIPRNTSSINDDFAFITLLTDRNFNAGGTQNDQQVGANYGGNANNSRGFFRYTQFVKIYDQTSPEITFTPIDECFVGNDASCRTSIAIEFTAVDECSNAIVTVQLDPFYSGPIFVSDPITAAALNVRVTNVGGNYTVTANNVPAGNHAIRVNATDGCGNFEVQVIEFCVVADRTPTPICIQTLTVVLADDGDNSGIAEIWGSDFIASPIFDCIGNPVTKYALYRADDAEATPENARFNPPATTGIYDIDCDDFANGTVRVRLFAFDEIGSRPNFCEVVVEVQDNAGFCGGSDGDLSGIITTDNDAALQGIAVTLTGANMDVTAVTDANGNFRFTGLTQGADFTVQPAFGAAANMRNIKTSDLTYMIGRILGTLEFDSPYDFIAADVTRDMDLNIFDVIATSQMILGIQTEFTGGNWRFVSADATISMSNPYGAAFPEVYNVNDLDGSLSNVAFVGVELGNPFHEAGRSATAISTEDVRLEAGQVHTMILDGSALAGFQGTIELAAGLELVAADFVGEGGLNLNNAAAGLIAIAVRENATVSLEVRATEAGLLSEMVSLTDAITVREGVSLNGASNSLSLNFAGVAATELVNSLGQNYPNPVADVTAINFTLAAAGQVTLSIQDVQGRTVMVQELEGFAGQNLITVNLKEMGAATGVLSYTLSAGNFSATKKMVVVR
jgi:hypothetical protein